MSAPPTLPREAVKEAIDDAEFGIVIVGEVTAMPTLGNVDESDIEWESRVESYRFGDWE